MNKNIATHLIEDYINDRVKDDGIFKMPEEDEVIHNEMSFDIPATISNQYTFGELVAFATKDFIKIN